MTLYCISLFLEKSKISEILEICVQNGFSHKELEITDQTGESGKGNQVDMNGVKILLLPCNDFHKNGDFEIGLTAENRIAWEDFVKKAGEICENEHGKFDDDETEYLLMGKNENDENLHGNFFFIFDGQKSELENLSKISLTIKNPDFVLFNEKIARFIDKNLLEKIEIASGEGVSLNALKVKNGEGEIIFPIANK